MNPDSIGNSIASWLFLLAGLAMLSAAALIPVSDDLALAEHQRNLALMLEDHNELRLDRYRGYLSSLDDPDETLLVSLAADQLRLIPPELSAVAPAAATANASVFSSLEPAALDVPPMPRNTSSLADLLGGGTARMAFLAFGGIAVLIGVFAPFAPDPHTGLPDRSGRDVD